MCFSVCVWYLLFLFQVAGFIREQSNVNFRQVYQPIQFIVSSYTFLRTSSHLEVELITLISINLFWKVVLVYRYWKDRRPALKSAFTRLRAQSSSFRLWVSKPCHKCQSGTTLGLWKSWQSFFFYLVLLTFTFVWIGWQCI